MTIELPWKVGDKVWYAGLSAANVPVIVHVVIEYYEVREDHITVIVSKERVMRQRVQISPTMHLYNTKAEAMEAIKNYNEERGMLSGNQLLHLSAGQGTQA